jgi:uncharacterized protein (DUF58 family)
MYLWKDRHLHLRITRLGLQYVAVMTVVGVLGVYTGNNLLHTIFALMIGLLLVSGWVSRASLQTIQPDHVSEGAFFARMKGGLRLRLSDNKPKRVRCLDIHLEISNCHSEPAFLPSARGNSAPLAVFRVRPKNRGIAKISSINFRTSHPFGFLEKTRRFAVDMQIIVAPCPIGYESPAGGIGEFCEPTPKSGYSGPIGARPFVAGDPTSLIHWKRTAQRGEPWVRLMEGDQPKGVFLEIDLTAWTPGNEFEEELEKISGAIFQAKLLKENVTLLILGRHGLRSVHGHLAAWKALAQLEGEGAE